MKKLFLALVVAMFATSIFAGVRLKPKSVQGQNDIPELTDYTDPVVESTLTDDDTPL